MNQETNLEDPRLHTHLLSGEVVCGHRSTVGDTLQDSDVYDSTSGKWKRCPAPGLVLRDGMKTILIRPVSD